MQIHETKIRTITLDSADIKQAIIMYLKTRGEKEIGDDHINLKPEAAAAIVTITEEITPKKRDI